MQVLFLQADAIDAVLSLIGVLGGIGAGFCQVFMLYFMREMFDASGDAEASGSFLPMAVANRMFRAMLFISLGLFVNFVIMMTAGNISAARQKVKWKCASLQAILKQDVGWFDVSKPQELASKTTGSVELIHKGLGGPSYMVFQAVGQCLGGIGFGIFFDAQVTGVMGAVFPLVCVALLSLVFVMNNSATSKIAAYSGADGVATESLFSMRTVASLGLEPVVASRFEQKIAGARKADMKVAASNGLAAGLGLASFLVLLAAGFLFGGYRTAGELSASAYPYSVNVTNCYGPHCATTTVNYCAHANNTPTSNFTLGSAACPAPLQPWLMTCRMGELLERFDGSTVFGANTSSLALLQQSSFDTFRAHSQAAASPDYLKSNPKYYGCERSAVGIVLAVFAVMFGAMGIANVGQPLQDLGAGRAAATELMKVANRVPAVDSFGTDGETIESVKGDIELRDVVFAYPAAPDHSVCNGYSLSIPSGQTVALCGPSGSGKSTIIQLIERFYDPQSGTVLLDGVDLKKLNVKWLRSQLGLVGQEPVLFMGTVAENIKYGKQDATDEEVQVAAKMANAHGFISTDLSSGYETDVGLRGSKLSGGQKQRVAIARAIIRKPSVLLLDEATSALDNESERIVQAALDEIMTQQKRTTIVIAHRLSTIRNADKIAVVSAGKVIEEGSHDELIGQPDGLYFNLVLAQQ